MVAMHPGTERPGYIFLISTLIIGFTITLTTITLLVLGMAAEMSGETVTQSNQVLELASTCADRALLGVRQDPSYVGNELLSYVHGTCRIYGVSSSADRRTVCAEGAKDGIVRRLQIDLDIQWRSSSSSALPDPLTDPPRIAAWNEVSCCGDTNSCSSSSS